MPRFVLYHNYVEVWLPVCAQEIPAEELEADDADKVISVFHFQKEVSRTHGVPFKFVVKPVSDDRCFNPIHL